MKNWIINIIAIVCAGLFVYGLLNPSIEIQEKLIPGDTVETEVSQSFYDSLDYWYKAKLDSVAGSKTIVYKDGIIDTLRDTVYVGYWSRFDLGTPKLGVSGNVIFNPKTKAFNFTSLCWRNIQIIKTVTDTLIRTETRAPTLTHGIGGGFGYGLIHGKFDFYVGYGGVIKFDITNIF